MLGYYKYAATTVFEIQFKLLQNLLDRFPHGCLQNNPHYLGRAGGGNLDGKGGRAELMRGCVGLILVKLLYYLRNCLFLNFISHYDLYLFFDMSWPKLNHARLTFSPRLQQDTVIGEGTTMEGLVAKTEPVGEGRGCARTRQDGRMPFRSGDHGVGLHGQSSCNPTKETTKQSIPVQIFCTKDTHFVPVSQQNKSLVLLGFQFNALATKENSQKTII